MKMLDGLQGNVNLRGFSVTVVAATAVLTLLLFYAIRIIYNLYFHPLAKFPGPWTAAISNLPYCYWFLNGHRPFHELDLHLKYGPVVRTAPNELSFNTSGAWKDIHDFRQGHQTFIKSTFYDGGSFADKCGSIVSERDPVLHGRMRKYLSNAFSQKSLTEQEFLISKSIDKFIRKLGKVGAQGTNIVLNFTLVSFDIIGDLGFGETFGGVESEEIHPWIHRMTGAMMKGAIADTAMRFPLFAKVAMTLFARIIERIVRDTKINEEYAIDLVKKRITKETNRKDFYTRILDDRDYEAFSDIHLAAHASDFVLAGSETSSTCLSAITYHLLCNEPVLRKLQAEIRGTFETYEQIDAASTASLKYMHAVILEGLRIYPPLPFALPRLVPMPGDSVDGHYLPGGTTVSISPIATVLDPMNFANPLEFNPDRWLNSSVTDDLNASQPFSMGPRGCIGRSLGWMEMCTILAKLHWMYDLELLNKDLKWFRDSRMHTLWEKPAMMVRVTPRITN